jgi:predicted GH43/DUF377 family glycosyl hydrolase
MSYQLKNPIIPGYYPDPSIIRVDDDFYLTCSSFEMFPGIPVFHSKDLAHWEQIGNALTEENGFHMERNCGVGGLMAPTIRYNNGTYSRQKDCFYIFLKNFLTNHASCFILHILSGGRIFAPSIILQI